MRFTETTEQPELTGKDLEQILGAAFEEGQGPELPRTWRVDNVVHETRLKFNSPTPVVSMEVSMIWEEPGRVINFELMYWQMDQEWEVLQVAGDIDV